MNTVTRWKYYWRRYLGWFPIQFCMVCGKAYWGGLPRIWMTYTIDQHELAKMKQSTVQAIQTLPTKRTIGLTWQACWMDYCSRKCAEEDYETL